MYTNSYISYGALLAGFLILLVGYIAARKEKQRDAKNTFIPDTPYDEETMIQEYVEERILKGKAVNKEMAIVKAMIAMDPSYAWSWHCNLVMSFVDEGCPKAVAMMGSARFLSILAQIDIKKDVRFIEEYSRLTKIPL